MNIEVNCIKIRFLVEKKREELVQLTKLYMLTSPEVIRVSQELDNLMNMFRKGKCH
ncbi:aspartyl-phosphate phosphatase Spo0E family protein [Bacillus thuringiensis]|nr:aspartyl-phosphate phosphatase Spo0E family protein [Bacillus thuringiensis]